MTDAMQIHQVLTERIVHRECELVRAYTPAWRQTPSDVEVAEQFRYVCDIPSDPYPLVIELYHARAPDLLSKPESVVYRQGTTDLQVGPVPLGVGGLFASRDNQLNIYPFWLKYISTGEGSGIYARSERRMVGELLIRFAYAADEPVNKNAHGVNTGFLITEANERRRMQDVQVVAEPLVEWPPETSDPVRSGDMPLPSIDLPYQILQGTQLTDAEGRLEPIAIDALGVVVAKTLEAYDLLQR